MGRMKDLLDNGLKTQAIQAWGWLVQIFGSINEPSLIKMVLKPILKANMMFIKMDINGTSKSCGVIIFNRSNILLDFELGAGFAIHTTTKIGVDFGKSLSDVGIAMVLLIFRDGEYFQGVIALTFLPQGWYAEFYMLYTLILLAYWVLEYSEFVHYACSTIQHSNFHGLNS